MKELDDGRNIEGHEGHEGISLLVLVRCVVHSRDLPYPPDPPDLPYPP
jgi:hypothetical protein